MRRVGQWIVVAVASVAIALGALALGAPASAAPGCICPMIYAPVRCSNGRTYSNGCVASCNHATGCVPVFVVPPPIQ